MTEPDRTPSFAQPRQKRSRETLVRILDAVEGLMATKGFEEFSVAEIARASGVSVGNFYNRFASKEQLLDVLQDRYQSDRTATVLAFVEHQRTIDYSLRERLEAITVCIWDLFSQRRFVLHSIIMRYWSQPADASQQALDEVTGLYEALTECLQLSADEITHPNQAEAATFAIQTILTQLRENLVVRPQTMPKPASREREKAIGNLVDMVHAFLTLK